MSAVGGRRSAVEQGDTDGPDEEVGGGGEKGHDREGRRTVDELSRTSGEAEARSGRHGARDPHSAPVDLGAHLVPL